MNGYRNINGSVGVAILLILDRKESENITRDPNSIINTIRFRFETGQLYLNAF